MSLYSRLDRLAADVEKLNRQVTAVANSPQSQRTSVEGGSIDFNDADGNLMAIMGGQDDGSNTIRHVDGPTPPIPSGLSAHVDGPIVQVSWDGTFESDVTHDWHYLEVLAVGPNDERLTGTINDLSGGETSLAATAQGDWVITARSVSRAGKRSLDGDAGTVAVQLVGLTGAIDAVQESANGKNTIYYSPTEPVAPDGGFNNGDLWFDTSEEGNNTASVWDGNGWVSMEDARLATIIAAQEALESDLQDVQTSVDGKNKITYDPALPPASYVGAVGDTWYRTSGNSMIGFWKWDGAAWVQQELSTTVIPQIDIGAGTFGSLSGVRLEAGSVSASSIAVGDFSNLATIDPVRNVNVTRPENWSTETVGDYITPKSTSQNYLMFKDRTNTVPFKAGDQLRVEFKGVSDVNGSALIRLRGYPALADGATSGLVGVSGDSFSFTTTEQSFSGKVTIPESFGASTTLRSWIIGLGPQGGLDLHGVRVRDVRVYRMTGNTLIQNGAITTDKLAVGSITAESGIIESLDLGTATVGELDGARIKGQTIHGAQLSGDAIDGMVITGATIRSAATGARTLMSASGFEAYDNTGKRTFFASASTGNVSMTGELYTGESGSERVVLDNSLWNSVGITDPDTGTQTNVPGAGVRIGVSSSSGADIYHGATPASGGRYVDQAVFRGPSGRARTVYGSASAGGGFPASSHVLSIADDNSGVVAAECRVTSSGIGSATRKVELIGADANGRSRALIRASGGNGKSNMWGLDANGIETSEVASDGPNRSAWLGGKDSSGALTAYVASFGNTGFTDISGSNQNPLNVNYTGTSDWWVVPFKKGGTSWGYVGSSGAMGVDEFGVQSAAGKNLKLQTTSSSDSVLLNGGGADITLLDDGGPKVRSNTIATTVGSPGSAASGAVYIRRASGNMFVSSSSKRYKTNISDAKELPRLLDVSVRTWQDKADVELAERLKKFREETGEGPVPQSLSDAEVDAPRSFGAVAEEVDELGLSELVRYDAYGRPDGLHYEMFGVALIPEIRKLRDRITELERLTNE